MHVLLHLAAIAATILILSRLLPGVRIRSVNTAVLVAIVFSLLNFFLGWAVSAALHVVLFLPALFTLGLLFVVIPFLVNAVMLWLTDKVMKSFEVQSVSALLIAAGALTIVNYFFAHSAAFNSFCSACHGGRWA
jgi:putative membrane protein